MKILVTGGAGFIGSHIVDKYIASGYDVAIVDDLTTGKKENINPKARFYKADLRNARSIDKIIAREKPEIINHQAAQKSVSHSVSDPTHDAEINIMGFLNLMESAKKHSVKRIVFASTGGAIYGNTKNIPTRETELPKPESPYAISKFSVEQYLRFYKLSSGIDYVVLRYSNVYGERQDPYGEAGVVAIFSKLIFQGQGITIFGDGRQTRDFVYVGDVANANIKAIKFVTDNADDNVFNIGTGVETPLNEIVDILKNVSGKAVDVDKKPARSGDLLRSTLDNKKAQTKLGWRSETTVEIGIEKTYRYFSK